MTNRILSCDWGTSAFRLRLVNAENALVLNEVKGQQGIAAVYNKWIESNQPESKRVAFYSNIFQSVLDGYFKEDIKDVPIIISGMASSTIGMKELPYAKLPFELSGDNLNIEKFEADNFCKNDILLISGLQTNVDVIRGEETLLLGCDINDDALVIFPGTHSKHVIVKDKEG